MAAVFYTIATLKANLVEKLEDKERGATAVEYGIMVALIAIVIIVAVTAIGTNLNTVFNTVATKLKTV